MNSDTPGPPAENVLADANTRADFPIRPVGRPKAVRAVRAAAECCVCRNPVGHAWVMVSYYGAAAHAGCAIADLAAGARQAERDARRAAEVAGG